MVVQNAASRCVTGFTDQFSALLALVLNNMVEMWTLCETFEALNPPRHSCLFQSVKSKVAMVWHQDPSVFKWPVWLNFFFFFKNCNFKTILYPCATFSQIIAIMYVCLLLLFFLKIACHLLSWQYCCFFVLGFVRRMALHNFRFVLFCFFIPNVHLIELSI